MAEKKFYDIGARGNCYKTIYARNLQNFIVSHNVCPRQAFQSSLMFVGKARNLP
jgi:hypothetical protein